MEQPQVTIGLPVYNGEKYLHRSINSLLAQDYGNFEIIISDNASTDGTPKICEQYAQKDSRITFRRGERNVGPVANFRYVLGQAQGPYFMWAAADDYWEPNFVSALLHELESHPEAHVAMSALERRWDDGLKRDVVSFSGSANPNTMGCLRMAMAMARKTEYHHYIYGLYRTAFLKSVMEYPFPVVPVGDRTFMCHVALLTRFRYVDEILHIRTCSRLPLYIRYPEEKFAKMTRDKWGYTKTSFTLASLLFQSKSVPYRYKLFIPLILLSYGFGFWREIVGPFLPFTIPTRRDIYKRLSQMSRQG